VFFYADHISRSVSFRLELTKVANLQLPVTRRVLPSGKTRHEKALFNNEVTIKTDTLLALRSKGIKIRRDLSKAQVMENYSHVKKGRLPTLPKTSISFSLRSIQSGILLATLSQDIMTGYFMPRSNIQSTKTKEKCHFLKVFNRKEFFLFELICFTFYPEQKTA